MIRKPGGTQEEVAEEKVTFISFGGAGVQSVNYFNAPL